MRNSTFDTVRVECLESFDGGLPQDFNLIVELEANVGNIDTNDAGSNGDEATMAKSSVAGVHSNNYVIANLTSRSASFIVERLSPMTTYKLTIYSSNAKGRSDAIVLSAATTAEMKGKKTGRSKYAFFRN